jgi:hypothetical protein
MAEVISASLDIGRSAEGASSRPFVSEGSVAEAKQPTIVPFSVGPRRFQSRMAVVDRSSTVIPRWTVAWSAPAWASTSRIRRLVPELNGDLTNREG